MELLDRTAAGIGSRARRLSSKTRSAARGYRVHRFDRWSSDVANAAEQLESTRSIRGRDLERLVAGRDDRYIAVVERHREPVLVAALRRRGVVWEPVTAGVCPWLDLPHLDGELAEGLAALGVEVLIPEYFGDPTHFPRADVRPFGVHVLTLDDDMERYWRQGRAWKNFARERRRLLEVEVVVDEAETLEWVLDRWQRNWSGHEASETVAAADMATAWRQPPLADGLQTIALVDGERLIAANVVARFDRRMLGLVTARDKSWVRGSAGTMLMLATIDVARSTGIDAIDIGGYSEYKESFAPVCDVRHTITVRPRYPEVVGRVGHGALRRARARVRGLPATQP